MLLAFSSSPAVPQAASDDVDTPALIQRVLDQRARALVDGNRDAWMVTVWTGAAPAFRDAQGRLFDGLRSAPLATYDLSLDLETPYDLGPAVAGRYDGRRVSLPPVRQRLRLVDFDDRDDIAYLWLTFVEDAGSWRVAADDDLSALGLDTDRGIWDGGAVTATRKGNVLVLHHPDTVSRVPAIARAAGGAITELDDLWPEPWSKTAVVLLPSSIAELQRMMQTTLDLEKFVAFVTYDIDRDEGWSSTAPRVLVQDTNLARYSERGQVETLVHEMVHAASAEVTGPFIPSWVHEGLAEWLAKGGRPERTAVPTGLPGDEEFSSGSQTSILAAYSRSTSVMARLAADAGSDAPVRLFTAVGAVRVAAGDSDYHLDTALREVAGTDAAGLTDVLRR